MIKHPTTAEIAASYELWMEYVDPGGQGTEEQFDAMTIDARIAFIEACFGPEEN